MSVENYTKHDFHQADKELSSPHLNLNNLQSFLTFLEYGGCSILSGLFSELLTIGLKLEIHYLGPTMEIFLAQQLVLILQEISITSHAK